MGRLTISTTGDLGAGGVTSTPLHKGTDGTAITPPEIGMATPIEE